MLSIDQRFDRDKFLLNQKALSLGNKYFIYDEDNQPLFFVDRPVLKLKADIGVYEDESRSRKLLTLDQHSAWSIINHAFSVLDENGQQLGQLKRQGWYSMIRRTWQIYDARGELIAEAREDSMWKAILRRITDLGAFFRTNFVIERPGGAELGQFNRKFTLVDKYVLDLSADRGRTLDRRVAVGLAIVLDTAESR